MSETHTPPAPPPSAAPQAPAAAGRPAHAGGYGHGPAGEPLDIRERGAPLKGEPQFLDRRLFMQLQVFTGVRNPAPLAARLADSKLDCALYLDANDPRGVGVMLMSENPADFTDRGRAALSSPEFADLTPVPSMTMIGRTYSLGREQNLEFWLLKKPVRTVLHPTSVWAVWYPLRRKPEFATLSPEEQGPILREHAEIGMRFGDADLAHDVRLACHGLDRADNDFVIGLLGKELFPLSRCVQEMRKTQQTSKWLASLGPFFVGKTYWQSPMPS
jgi:chlorite dismutase